MPRSYTIFVVLINMRQQAKLGKLSDPQSFGTVLPGGVLSFLLSLYTNDCISVEPAVKILKFAGDTTLVGFIANSDECAYRKLSSWSLDAAATTCY